MFIRQAISPETFLQFLQLISTLRLR